MKTRTRSMFTFLSTLTLGTALLGAPAHAADKAYQVTGPVPRGDRHHHHRHQVQKGKEKWLLARTKGHQGNLRAS